MSTINFNNETIKLISLFEKITRSKLHDCFLDSNNVLIFVVEEGEIAKAVGKQAANVKKLRNMLNRSFRIIEYSKDITTFIKNLIFPLKVKGASLEDDIIVLDAADSKTRGLIIGRNATNLRNYEFIAKKYFPIKEIKV